jgi:hypothetical protein
MRVVSVRILLIGILLFFHPTRMKTVALGQSPTGTTGASTSGSAPAEDALLRLLVNKGVLTTEEAAVVLSSGNQAQQRDRLATLLKDKGLISNAEFEALQTGQSLQTPSANAASASATNSTAAAVSVSRIQKSPPPPSVIAAIAPVRLLPIEPQAR